MEWQSASNSFVTRKENWNKPHILPQSGVGGQTLPHLLFTSLFHGLIFCLASLSVNPPSLKINIAENKVKGNGLRKTAAGIRKET